MLWSMLSHLDILGLIFGHPKLLLGLLVVALAAGLLIFKGAFVKFITGPRTLLVIAGAVALLTFSSMHNEVAGLRAENQALAAQVQTTQDGLAAVSFKATQEAVNTRNTAKLHQVIQDAPTGQAVDSVLDEIARQDAEEGAGGSGAQPDADAQRLRDDGTKP